jgi:hypothetical protein
MKSLVLLVLISTSIFEHVESKAKNSGTLQYDFGKENGQNILILKTDNLFLPEGSKGGKKKDKLDIKVTKSVLLTKRAADAKLEKEIRRRKKIERLLKKERAKLKKKRKTKRQRKLMFGGGDELKQKKELKESLSMFKTLEKASFRDSMDLLFKVRLKVKALPGKIGTIAKNFEDELGFKEEAVEKALQAIDVKLGD